MYVGSGLERPFDLGVNTSGEEHDWVTAEDSILTLAYPAGQQWGAVFITVGKSVPPEQRNEDHALDLSAYNFLVFDMRAEVDGQCIKVGIKDWRLNDPYKGPKQVFCDRVKEVTDNHYAFNDVGPLPEWGFSKRRLLRQGHC